MSDFLKKIQQLPLDIQLLICEYDPERRLVLDKLCNMLRLYVPYWYFKKGYWTRSMHYDLSMSRVKENIMRSLEAVSECCFCDELKSSGMILEYLGSRRYSNGCGLYCDICFNKLLTLTPSQLKLNI